MKTGMIAVGEPGAQVPEWRRLMAEAIAAHMAKD